MPHLRSSLTGSDLGAPDFQGKLRRPAWLFLAVFWMAFCGAIPGRPAQNTPAAESGVFSILSSQRQIGTEKFKITTAAAGLEASGELQVEIPGGPRTAETSLLKLDAKLQPLSYERQQKSPKKGSVIAQFGSPQAKLTSKTEAGAEERSFNLPDNHLVVLDTNFFHHYALLVRQYNPSQTGPQVFTVFVPQEATPGEISLELQGKEGVTVGKITREFNHFQAVAEDVKIDIWASPQGEIYRISIPQANLEIVRQ
jgi:hypothetical protein